MKNPVMLKKMIDDYNRIAFTHQYIFGFSDRGVVYAVKATSDILPFVCCLDTSSRTSGYSLRFKPTTEQKELLKTCGAEPICSVKYFEDLVKDSKYNRGEIFEKIVTEKAGQVWKKDRVPFTVDGDVTIDGVAYQIKYDKATFATENSLANLVKDFQKRG